ncbi:MAG: hypothetical protein K940chlam1_00084 [Candidatus Anoxychlamydiales bacterium]|nr:hypothetical protein [Candidatus Anoxychlamydiales bacterium]NGX35546.1 hypothetical protein [Candidatus Anoxychlamydiales bacterium]
MKVYLEDCKKITFSWEVFLKMSVDYITTYWPSVLKNKTKTDFQKEYKKKLKKQSEEKFRGLFLIKNNSKIIGIANVYLKENILYIAEFFIDKKYRRKGFGSKVLKILIRWGKSKGASSLKVEVDKSLVLANAFWSSMDLQLNGSGKRNIYFSKNI